VNFRQFLQQDQGLGVIAVFEQSVDVPQALVEVLRQSFPSLLRVLAIFLRAGLARWAGWQIERVYRSAERMLQRHTGRGAGELFTDFRRGEQVGQHQRIFLMASGRVRALRYASPDPGTNNPRRSKKSALPSVNETGGGFSGGLPPPPVWRTGTRSLPCGPSTVSDRASPNSAATSAGATKDTWTSLGSLPRPADTSGHAGGRAPIGVLGGRQLDPQFLSVRWTNQWSLVCTIAALPGRAAGKWDHG